MACCSADRGDGMRTSRRAYGRARRRRSVRARHRRRQGAGGAWLRHGAGESRSRGFTRHPSRLRSPADSKRESGPADRLSRGWSGHPRHAQRPASGLGDARFAAGRRRRHLGRPARHGHVRAESDVPEAVVSAARPRGRRSPGRGRRRGEPCLPSRDGRAGRRSRWLRHEAERRGHRRALAGARRVAGRSRRFQLWLTSRAHRAPSPRRSRSARGRDGRGWPRSLAQATGRRRGPASAHRRPRRRRPADR